MLYTLIGIGTIVYLLFVLAIAIPIASLLVTLRAHVTGRYLNRYYIVSYKGSGTYELHCSPAFGFYYARSAKYFALRDDAIRKFKEGYPNTSLYAVTSTLQGYYTRQGVDSTPVTKNRYMRFVGDVINYILIFLNIANYRKRNDQEWQFAHLIRRVRQTTPRRYLIIDGNCLSEELDYLE